MQINDLRPTAGPELRRVEQPAVSQPSRLGSDAAEFRATAALEEALADTPDVRPDQVNRARELFASVQYPPAELIRGVSRLLADNWPPDQA
jgi:hypothetical protein